MQRSHRPLFFFVALAMSAFFATPTAARDTLLNLSIQEALQEGE